MLQLFRHQRRALFCGAAALVFALVLGSPRAGSTPVDAVRVVGADYFESYAGSFIDVTAKSTDSEGCVAPACPTLSVTYSTDGTTLHSGPQTTMAPPSMTGCISGSYPLDPGVEFRGDRFVPRPGRRPGRKVSHGGVAERPVGEFLDSVATLSGRIP